MVSPGSSAVKRQAEAEGLTRIFLDAGLEWRDPGCSMCNGSNGELVAPGERCASTTNRNFEGRQGRGALTHIMSPAMVAAAAVFGRITDVRRLSGIGRRCSRSPSSPPWPRPSKSPKIDTGMILPGRYMRRHRRPGHDYGEAFLYDLRFDEKAKPRADFALNQPAYRDAEILVTDSDFGCGSSREGAAFAVMDFGLRAGRAELRRNLPGQLHPERHPRHHAARGGDPRSLATIEGDEPGAEITIDLPARR